MSAATQRARLSGTQQELLNKILVTGIALFILIGFIMAIVAGSIIVALTSDHARNTAEIIRTKPLKSLGIGFEMIMEAWGFEYPFNDRAVFVREWEELWLRYLIARYDAFGGVYFWTLMNEYEFYPDGDWRHGHVADRWAI